jgi:hypothetical protein
MFELASAFGRDILPPAVNMRLDHHACDVALSCRELCADGVDDTGLIVVVFLRVAISRGNVNCVDGEKEGGAHSRLQSTMTLG